MSSKVTMDWSKSHNQLSSLVQSRVKGSENLYTSIPFFMRTELHSLVNETPWSQLSNECEQNLPESKENAIYYYEELLNQMEEYISDKIGLQKSFVDNNNATYMRLAKNLVEKEFGNDAVKFVKEIDLCFSKERELIRMNTVSDEDEVMYTDETDIPEKRLKYKDLIAQLEKDISDLKTTLNEPIIQDPSQFAAQEDQDDMQSCTETTLSPPNDMAMNIIVKLYDVMDSLELEVVAWQTAETQASIKTGLHIDLTYIREDFCDFGRLLNMLSDVPLEDNRLQQRFKVTATRDLLLGTLQDHFKLVHTSYFNCNLVVCAQPKDLISIENKDSKTAKKKEGGSHSGEKKDVCYGSRKKQDLKTTILLLGAKSFSGLTIRKVSIELISDEDLAEEKKRNINGRPGQAFQKCATINGKPIIKGNQDTEYSIEWPDLQVTEFTRLDTTAVYRQFFRFRFIVRLEVHQNEYTVKAMSLPFTFNTGANQQLENIGSRFWYCANVDMYHGDFICPNSLPVERVMDMLNKRVMHITKKQRALTEEDKSFLLSRLSVNGDNTVHMQNFIKDKMPPTNSKKERPSFYTWFHGIMNTLTHTLEKPWEKGIIYGFSSEQRAKEKLLDENVPAGTVLFRPSVSKVNNMSSKEATTALIMEVKIKTPNADSNGGFEVLSVPLYINNIKGKGFHRTVKNIKIDGKQVAHSLYGMNGRDCKPVDILMEFGNGERKPEVFDGYRLMVNTFETVHIERINQLGKENKPDNDSKKPKLSKRKQVPDDSHHATMSPSTDDSPRTFTMLQKTLAQPNVPVGIKVEDIPATSSFSGTELTIIVHDQQPQKFTQMDTPDTDNHFITKYETIFTTPQSNISTALQCGGNIPNHLHEAQGPSRKKSSRPRPLETNLQEHQQNACQGHQQQYAGQEHEQQNADQGHEQQNADQGHEQQNAGQGHEQQNAGQGHEQQYVGQGHEQQNAGQGHEQQYVCQGHEQQNAVPRSKLDDSVVWNEEMSLDDYLEQPLFAQLISEAESTNTYNENRIIKNDVMMG